MGKLVKDQPEWHIGQDIANTREMPEEVTVKIIVANVVMYKKIGFVSEFPDDMAKVRVKIVMPVESVGIRMVTIIIIPPAVYGPVVVFPLMIPVQVFSVIVLPVIIIIVVLIMNMIPGIIGFPVIFIPFEIFRRCVTAIFSIKPVDGAIMLPAFAG